MIYAIVILVVLLLFVITLYNSLVRRKNDVENAFASVDVMLKKRYDLIPNLVETVKSYMKHEKSLLTELTEMRARAISGEISNDERVALENKISKGISGVMVAVENYPDLKASQNFLQLQAAWNEAEEQISAARRFFNTAVTAFNKNFNGHTIVLPDTAERMLGKLGQNLQSMSSRGELVKLEDPEFEKEFCVYSDDQVEARYILSPSLIKRIVDFKRKWNTKVYLSFRDSKVYIAIKMNKNLFETRLFKSIVDYNFIEENIRFLVLLTGIVEDLNLNTRIWTKK